MERPSLLRRFLGSVVLPIAVVIGAFAIAAGLLEGPALQPFLYGVF